MYVYMCVHMYVCVCIYVCVYVCVCMYMCTYVCMYISKFDIFRLFYESLVTFLGISRFLGCVVKRINCSF